MYPGFQTLDCFPGNPNLCLHDRLDLHVDPADLVRLAAAVVDLDRSRTPDLALADLRDLVSSAARLVPAERACVREGSAAAALRRAMTSQRVGQCC